MQMLTVSLLLLSIVAVIPSLVCSGDLRTTRTSSAPSTTGGTEPSAALTSMGVVRSLPTGWWFARRLFFFPSSPDASCKKTLSTPRSTHQRRFARHPAPTVRTRIARRLALRDKVASIPMAALVRSGDVVRLAWAFSGTLSSASGSSSLGAAWAATVYQHRSPTASVPVAHGHGHGQRCWSAALKCMYPARTPCFGAPQPGASTGVPAKMTAAGGSRACCVPPPRLSASNAPALPTSCIRT